MLFYFQLMLHSWRYNNKKPFLVIIMGIFRSSLYFRRDSMKAKGKKVPNGWNFILNW